MRRTSAGSRTRPSFRASQSRSSEIVGGVLSSAQLSARPPTRRIPGERIGSSSRARARARRVLTGSCAFSKRMEASVRSFSDEDVRRTLPALKLADSKTMEVVPAEMALSLPPITPAMAMGPEASAMTRFAGEREYVSSLRATIDSPSRAGRAQMVSPASFARSNACVGWASSAIR